jgi:hypothetical protein
MTKPSEAASAEIQGSGGKTVPENPADTQYPQRLGAETQSLISHVFRFHVDPRGSGKQTCEHEGRLRLKKMEARSRKKISGSQSHDQHTVPQGTKIKGVRCQGPWRAGFRGCGIKEESRCARRRINRLGR